MKERRREGGGWMALGKREVLRMDRLCWSVAGVAGCGIVSFCLVWEVGLIGRLGGAGGRVLDESKTLRISLGPLLLSSYLVPITLRR